MVFNYFIVQTTTKAVIYVLLHRKYIVSEDINLHEKYKVYYAHDDDENLPHPLPKLQRKVDTPKKGGVYWAKIREQFGKL